MAEYCIRCGICENLYPELFQRNYETHQMDVLFDEIPEVYKERVRQAQADFAVAAILIKE